MYTHNYETFIIKLQIMNLFYIIHARHLPGLQIVIF